MNSIIDQQIQDREVLPSLLFNGLTDKQKEFFTSVVKAAFQVQSAAIQYAQSIRTIPKFRTGGRAIVGECGKEIIKNNVGYGI